MKQFTAFIKKEFHHILRDKRTMLILLVLPIALIILLGFAMSTEIRNVNVAYMSDQPDESVRRIVNRVDASPYFIVKQRVFSIDEGTDLMRKNKVDVIIRFQNEKGLQIVVDAGNPNIGTTEAMFLQGIIVQELQSEQQFSSLQNSPYSPNLRLLYNPQMKSSFNFVPGIMGLILILISAMMTSVSIVREKETGTMEVLLTSPIRPIFIIIAKMVPYFVVSCVNLATILLLAKFVLMVPLSGNIGLICLFSLLYIFMSLGLGLLISTISSSQTVAILLSAVVLMIPIMMLSGMLFPIESMPAFFRGFSCIIPARWYIDAMRKLMIEGVSFRYVQNDLYILLCMTVFFIGIALAKFKKRLE